MVAVIEDAPTPTKKENNFNIPNLLTSLRILSIPFVVLLLHGETEPWQHLVAAILFGAAFLTDQFDGIIARKTNQITRLGKVLDPMADKLMVTAALLMLTYRREITIWIPLLLLSREISISGLRAFAQSEGVAIPSSLLAKIKTYLEGFGIGFAIVGTYYNWFGFYWGDLGVILLWISVVAAIWSGFQYFMQFFSEARELRAL